VAPFLPFYFSHGLLWPINLFFWLFSYSLFYFQLFDHRVSKYNVSTRDNALIFANFWLYFWRLLPYFAHYDPVIMDLMIIILGHIRVFLLRFFDQKQCSTREYLFSAERVPSKSAY
jgi:hypothetical protein